MRKQKRLRIDSQPLSCCRDYWTRTSDLAPPRSYQLPPNPFENQYFTAFNIFRFTSGFTLVHRLIKNLIMSILALILLESGVKVQRKNDTRKPICRFFRLNCKLFTGIEICSIPLILKYRILCYHLFCRNFADVVVSIAHHYALSSQCFFLEHPFLGKFQTVSQLLVKLLYFLI